MAKILVVEDERDLARLIAGWLTREKHLVEVVHDGSTAWHQMKTSSFDVLVLDWMLPEITGVELCKKYRSNGGSGSVIILTAKDTLADKEVGFSAGADDYVTKPFELKELAMRINAQLRRVDTSKHTLLKVRDIEIDIEKHKVFKSGAPVSLMPKEFRLLEFFIRHPARVFSSEELIQAVWESDSLAQNDTVRGHITRLRKKLDSPECPSIVTTVHGVGYKLGTDD